MIISHEYDIRFRGSFKFILTLRNTINHGYITFAKTEASNILLYLLSLEKKLSLFKGETFCARYLNRSLLFYFLMHHVRKYRVRNLLKLIRWVINSPVNKWHDLTSRDSWLQIQNSKLHIFPFCGPFNFSLDDKYFVRPTCKFDESKNYKFQLPTVVVG